MSSLVSHGVSHYLTKVVKFDTLKVFTYVYVVGMLSMAWLIIRWPIAQLVERGAVNSVVLGSSPSGPVREISSAVERFVYTEDVTGSIPVSPMSNTKHDP